MKKQAWLLIPMLLFASGCTGQNHPDDGFDESLYRDEGNGALDFVNHSSGNTQSGKNLLGYSRQHGKETYNATDGGSIPGPDVYIDRNVLARQIAYLSTKLPQVEQCSVVVTDDQVFIGVTGTDQKAVSDKILYETKRTALSLTPRYYKINVTKDPTLCRKLDTIGHQALKKKSNTGMQSDEVDKLLQQMGDKLPPKFNEQFKDTPQMDKLNHEDYNNKNLMPSNPAQ